VAGQVALSLALLIGATLLARSAMRLQYADAGFDIGPLLSLRLYLAGDRYDPPAAKAQALDDISARIAALPGVSAVALTGAIPADDGGLTLRAVPDYGLTATGREIGVQVIPTTAQLWNALGVSLDAGRTFTDAEIRDSDADVAIVNRSLARTFWPGDVAIGHRLGLVDAGTIRWMRVVGTAPDIVYEEFGEETEQSRLNVYLPYARLGWRTMALLVRTASDPAASIAPVRRAVREIDPAIAPYDVLTMRARRTFTQWGERFVGRMFAGFALTALLMACLGAYGLMSYSAGQRTREVGVRLALGAKAGDVMWLFLRRGIGLTLAGLIAGAPLAFATARAIEGLLFRVSPWAVTVWASVPVALVFALLIASYVPARRASRADPAMALRQE
jgi:predicted permease